MIVLKGDDGVVIIDTLESCEVAKEVREAFEEVRGPELELFIETSLLKNVNQYGQSWMNITNSE